MKWSRCINSLLCIQISHLWVHICTYKHPIILNYLNMFKTIKMKWKPGSTNTVYVSLYILDTISYCLSWTLNRGRRKNGLIKKFKTEFKLAYLQVINVICAAYNLFLHLLYDHCSTVITNIHFWKSITEQWQDIRRKIRKRYEIHYAYRRELNLSKN